MKKDIIEGMKYGLAMGLFGALVWVFLNGVSVAQQPAPQPPETPANVQALANRLTAEINNNLTCTASVITLQEQVKKLSAELAEAKKPKEPVHDGDGTPAKKKP